LLAIGGQTKAILKRLTVFAFLIGGIVLFYMSLLQFQRNEQKIAEIGMLKAIGMAPKGLLALALAEATVLWLFGAALGIVASILLGPLAAIDQIVAGEPMRIVYSGKLMAVTIALSFLMCILSNIWATRRSRRDPASVSLRAG
jgi:putative ABC transport system permease protein